MQGRKLTPQQLSTFLTKLRSSNGNVSAAAKAAKMSRGWAYEVKNSNPDFAKAWDDIIDACVDEAEQELYRRAVKGVEEPVWHQGQEVGAVRKYSDRLIEFYLKSKRPDIYRERMDVNQTITASLDVNIESEIDKLYDDAAADDGSQEVAGLLGDAETD